MTESRLELTASEKEARLADHSLSTNGQGQQILVGLTIEESIWLVDFERQYGKTPSHSSADRDRFITLTRRHERARFRAIDERLSSWTLKGPLR